MDFNIGNLVSSVVGAVVAVAIAVAEEISSVRQAVIGAEAAVANGESDEEEINEAIEEANKVLVGAFMAMFGNGKSSLSSDNDDIDSLPEYDPLTARIKENKGTRVKKKGANDQCFAGTIDEFGNFIPDDSDGFYGENMTNNDPSSISSRCAGFISGILDDKAKQIEGLWNSVKHPVDTATAVYKFLDDSDYRTQAIDSISTKVKDAYDTEVVNGDATTSAHFWGEVFDQIATVIATDGASTDADAGEEITFASSIIPGGK
ncbi:hypothetical protein [Clostridium saccharobutylicum]|uniref:Uncharacterized protein n=1 Tax=Clostridium saccharobutylicum TaxID=169679 RepID=A0A1S8NHE2_CLOSA|nr:hypothetical protein [Clostridium saccharobutylicum]OOM15895.1 hypothetical protein CLOSAC_01660 [Clostridium saccharobutylicum]